LFFLDKENRLRKFFYFVTKQTRFDNLILAMIVISSIKLAVDTYIDTSDEKS